MSAPFLEIRITPRAKVTEESRIKPIGIIAVTIEVALRVTAIQLGVYPQ